MKQLFILTPQKLAQVAPCDWSAVIDHCHDFLASMPVEERLDCIDAQSYEANYRRSVKANMKCSKEIEAEIALLRRADIMTCAGSEVGSVTGRAAGHRQHD